ncbi:MAG TPA: hypothetical protein P5548_00015 [Candidatus Moranbacteria bacterium]|nr:hypothetical protein [Candidatus Moranbacteria bacterium]HRZ33277.1 hypothetical protein [Candidatus Moranbacteria bacterium]
MKNLEPENNLAHEESWEKIASVLLKGDKKALSLNSEKDEEYNQAVFSSWENVVVLHVMAPKKTKFHIAFATRKKIKYLPQELETDLKFAVRIGPKDFKVFIIPDDIRKKVMLEVVEYTKVDNEKYKDLILL